MKTLDDGHSYIGWLFNEEVIGSNPTSFLVVVFAILGRFLVYFRLFKQALKFLKQIDVKFFMTIQYTALEFERTTFGVFSHNH